MQTSNISNISGHANVTSVGRDYNITYESIDDGRTNSALESIDERLKISYDKAASTSHSFTLYLSRLSAGISE